MEICIIGAGAMGGLFAALLAPQANVTLLTNNQTHAAAIENQGLTLETLDGGKRNLKVRVLTEASAHTGRFDLVLICTKAGSTQAAARTAATLATAEAVVLTLQNGLGNLERITAEVGSARAAAGVTAQAATLLGPGRVRHTGAGSTVLGATSGQDQRLRAVVALFNRAGIPASLTDDLDRLLWSKLVVNVGINALTALLRVPNGSLIGHAACEDLMAEAVHEAVVVAHGLGIRLDPDQQLARVREVCRLTALNRSSMLQDILRGASTEIDVINGAVVDQGQAIGLLTPVNSLLVRLIKALEATARARI
jgi:2-dehydropantoate 2-reductase